MSRYDDMYAALQNPASKIEGSFSQDNLLAVAAELDNIWEKGVSNMPMRFFPSMASGEDLTLSAANFGINRKAAGAAQVLLTISGEEGAEVPAGLRAAAGDIVFEVLNTTDIPKEGSVDVLATAAEVGEQGNVLAGQVIELADDYPGITGVTNAAAASGGSEEESDDELRRRVNLRWSLPMSGGNKSDYVRWATEIQGVYRAQVTSPSAGCVTVYITAAGNTVPSTELIAEVQEHIDNLRPLCAEVTVTAGTAVNVRLSARVLLDPGYTVAGVRGSVIPKLKEFLAQVTYEQSMVGLMEVSEVLKVEGVRSYDTVRLNAMNSNITLGTGEFPVYQAVSLSAD